MYTAPGSVKGIVDTMYVKPSKDSSKAGISVLQVKCKLSNGSSELVDVKTFGVPEGYFKVGQTIDIPCNFKAWKTDKGFGLDVVYFHVEVAKK
jgi:hypothetical protein